MSLEEEEAAGDGIEKGQKSAAFSPAASIAKSDFATGDDDEEDNEPFSVEQLFEGKEVPPWRSLLTVRAFFVSFILGFFLSFIVMKLNLTSGIVPSLNVSAGLLSFFLVKSWIKIFETTGVVKQPFTRQENSVIQSCVVACCSVALTGGFGSYILGMSEKVAKDFDQGNNAANVKEPTLGWLIGFLFVVTFGGLVCHVPLRKTMLIDYKLTFPSGAATAHLINSFHTPQGALLARKQVTYMFRSFLGSFFWSFFQWFYTAGDGCGFVAFPTFGLKAYENKFYFDFSATYVGVGMICPFMINLSMLVGSIISWGILWPYIESKKGNWYPATIPESSLHGLNGYKVFISIAMILGDGLFHFAAVFYRTLYDLYSKRRIASYVTPFAADIHVAQDPDPPALSFDDRRRMKVFLKDQIPDWIPVTGFLVVAFISMVSGPYLIPALRFYHVLAAYAIAPIFTFSNCYGSGLTDWSLASSYGKLAIFIFGAWVGVKDGGILAGLSGCGLIMGIVSTVSDLMQDCKTGYLTLTSPLSLFVGQSIGTAMGCVIAPAVFWIYFEAFVLGDKDSDYPAPYAAVYRGIAILGTEGFKALPRNCVRFCIVFFFAAVAINAAKEVARRKNWKLVEYMPSAMAMAIPFYLGSYFTIDMCVGSFSLYLWKCLNKKSANSFSLAVASGMICGDGIWSLPASLLALLKVTPPICMKFLANDKNSKVDAFLTMSRTVTGNLRG